MKTFVRRRSVNFFQKDLEISDRELKNIVNLAGLAPSSSNTQPWELVVARDETAKQNLYECTFDQPKVIDSSATLVLLADPDGYKKDNPLFESFLERGYMEDREELENYKEQIEELYSGLEKPDRYAVKNAAFFGMSLMLAAESYGWQTHPMIGFNPDDVKSKFDVPEKKIVPMLIALGKFDESRDLFKRNRRKSFDDVVSFNSYEEPEELELENQFVESSRSIQFQGNPLELLGIRPELGEKAPDFCVNESPGTQVRPLKNRDKPLVISAVPSIDTPVCQEQTKTFNRKLKGLEADVDFVTISCDTPFAQARFAEQEEIDFPIYSDLVDRDFSTKYGLLLRKLGLCARAVLVVGGSGKVEYFQLVEKMGEEPDYEETLEFIESNLVH